MATKYGVGNTYIQVNDDDTVDIYIAGSKRVTIDDSGTTIFKRGIIINDDRGDYWAIIKSSGSVVGDGGIKLTQGSTYHFYIYTTGTASSTNGLINIGYGSSSPGTLRFKFRGDGTAYADVGWQTFSPIMPEGIKGYEWLEVAKEDAYKPCKPKTLKMQDMTEDDIKKYAKDPCKIAMANTRCLDYVIQVQKNILKKLMKMEERLNAIR